MAQFDEPSRVGEEGIQLLVEVFTGRLAGCDVAPLTSPGAPVELIELQPQRRVHDGGRNVVDVYRGERRAGDLDGLRARSG